MSATNENPKAEAEQDLLSVGALQAEVERLKKLCETHNISESEEKPNRAKSKTEDPEPPTSTKPKANLDLEQRPNDEDLLKKHGRGYRLLQEAAKRQNEHEAQLAQALGAGDMSALPMLRQVTSATFFEAVKENMECFDMTEEEAKEEAVAQFKRQGVDARHFLSSSTE